MLCHHHRGGCKSPVAYLVWIQPIVGDDDLYNVVNSRIFVFTLKARLHQRCFFSLSEFALHHSLFAHDIITYPSNITMRSSTAYVAFTEPSISTATRVPIMERKNSSDTRRPLRNERRRHDTWNRPTHGSAAKHEATSYSSHLIHGVSDRCGAANGWKSDQIWWSLRRTSMRTASTSR